MYSSHRFTARLRTIACIAGDAGLKKQRSMIVETTPMAGIDELGAGTERYELRTRRDILPVLTGLAKWPIPIKARIAQLDASFTSRLIAVNPAFEELVFDATGLEGAERLDGSEGLVAEAQMDTVWFRFETEHVEYARGYEHPVFRARMPSLLSRLQRRDSIRYPVPAMNGPVCDVPDGDGVARLRAIDISYTGIALLVENPRMTVDCETTLSDCLLQLPDIGTIATELHIAYVARFGDGDQRKIGCRFTNMKTTSLDHLHRYVSRLERVRLGRLNA